MAFVFVNVSEEEILFGKALRMMILMANTFLRKDMKLLLIGLKKIPVEF